MAACADEKGMYPLLTEFVADSETDVTARYAGLARSSPQTVSQPIDLQAALGALSAGGCA